MKKTEQLALLKSEGFITPGYSVFKGNDISPDMLTSHLLERKSESPFALDGIVLTVNDESVCADLTNKKKGTSLNPAFSKKFKVAEEDNFAITKVKYISWKISKAGYIKPTVEIEPVDLVGVTISRATGFNAKFIKDMGIGPDAVVKIIRSGDVIPYITGVETPSPTGPQLPTEAEYGELEWTENEVDIKLVNVSDNEDVKFQQLVAAFNSLGVENLSTASLQKLFDAGYTEVQDIIKAEHDTVYRIVGSRTALKGMDSLQTILSNVSLEKLGAASNAYGRGMGERRLRKIVEEFNTVFDLELDQIASVESFNTITAQQVLDGEEGFKQFLSEIDGYYKLAEKKEVATGGNLEGSVFVFTGFRDKDLEQRITDNGGSIASSVSKKVTHLVAKSTDSMSGKMKKAADMGIKVISVDDLSHML